MEYIPLRTLSVAAPAYNEAEGITAVIESWYKYLKNDNELTDFEIVICNDGSKDNTGKILRDFASRYSEIKIVEHAKNKGAAAALYTAVRSTSMDWVLLLDTDGQFPAENLANFRNAMKGSKSFSFLGVRTRKADSLFARFGTWSSGLVCNLFLRTKYKDFNCACKLIDGRLIRRLNLEAKGLNYSTDITAKLLEAGFPPVEVEILHNKRTKGKSSRTLMRGTLHRLLFVGYIIYRHMLLSLGVLQKRSDI